MNILVLTDDFPATTRMPGSPRLFNLCRELSGTGRHLLTLGLFRQNPEREKQFGDDPDTAGVFTEVLELPLLTDTSVLWWRRQLHRLLFTPFLSHVRRHPEYVNAVRGKVNQAIAERNIDLLLVNGLCMSQYIDWRSEIPVVIDLCDCLSFLFSQQAKFEPSLPRKLALTLEWVSIAAWERAMSRRASLVTLISKVDEAQLLRLAPGAKSAVVPNGIDVGFFAPSGARKEMGSGPRLLFTGVMAYPPNADAAISFVTDVFPLVRQSLPHAEFWVVGAAPPPEVQALSATPGVHVTGEVEDVREQLGAADIFVCPLRYGAGMKNKILAALAVELPVIATPLSLLGLETKPGVHLLTAETPEEFVQKIMLLRSEPETVEALRKNGRDLVVSRCSWTVHGAKLEQALNRLQTEAANQSAVV